MTLAKIPAKHFVYRVCYGGMKKPPQYVRRWNLIFRFLWSLLIAWPLFILFCATVAVIITSTSFFFARRLPFLKGDDRKQFLVPYTHWVTIKGKRIWPLWLVVSYAVWKGTSWLGSLLSMYRNGYLSPGLAVLLLVIVFVVPCVILFYLIDRYFRSSLHRQIMIYVREWWNQKVNPIMIVTGLPKDDTTDDT